jgi:hypothetical protein
MPDSKRPALHAYISQEAEDVLNLLTDTTGVSKTGLVQTWLLNIGERLESCGRDEDGVEAALGVAFIRTARKADAVNRHRRSR